MSFGKLPNELTFKIIGYLDISDIINLTGICKHLREIAISDALWSDINQRVIGEHVDINAYAESINASQYFTYISLFRHAINFIGIHAGDVYPQGHILNWSINRTTPESEGNLLFMRNRFNPSNEFVQELDNLGYMITNDGKLIYRLDEVIDAGLNTHIEDLPDLLVKFTGNITNPVVAYDVESGEEKVTKYTQESVPIDSLDNTNLRTYPSRELCHLVERMTLNTINVHTFHRPYPWPDDEPLRTVKLDTSRLDRDPLEGFFSAEYGSHGIEILAAKKSVQAGSNTLEFVKVTGDNNVPRGLVSIRVNLDQEIRDSELLEDSDIRVSSDDNLPWPLTCPTRPIGKSYSAQGKIANSEHHSPRSTPVIVHIENPDVVYVSWTELRNTIVIKRIF